jgi:hypothetical protein
LGFLRLLHTQLRLNTLLHRHRQRNDLQKKYLHRHPHRQQLQDIQQMLVQEDRLSHPTPPA